MSEPHCLAFLADRTSVPLPDDVAMEGACGYTAVFGPPPRLRATRKAVIRDAAARMARLEQLMACGTVIPTLPDVVMGPALAGLAIRANRVALDAAAERLRGRVQFQLTVSCDATAAVAHFRGRPAPFGPVGGPSDLPLRLAGWVDARLDGVAVESLGLPLAGTVVVNRAILVPVDRQVALDGVLEEIDALWTEGMAIRLTGPSPGVSHASVAMRLVTAREVTAALATLALAPGADGEAIAAARRRVLLSGAPPARIGRMAEVLRLAAAAGWPEGPIPELSLWSEGRAAPAVEKGAA